MNARLWTRSVVAAVASIVGSSCLLPAAVWAQADSGSPMDAGEVVIVDAVDRTRSIEEGDSNTVFSLRLPVEASCPGDSANDDWRVQSFLIPAADDPATLEFGGVRPKGEGQNALYAVDTAPFINVLTAQNSGPGEPGQILGIPPLSFAVFPPGYLPAGEYRLGIACSQIPATTQKYWDTSIVVEVAPEVEPGQLRWRLAQLDDEVAATAGGDDGGAAVAPWLVVAGLGALVVIGIVVIRRRTATSTAQLAKEHG